MDNPQHEVVAIALGFCRCRCGWQYRVEKFKAKSDEDLSIEVGSELQFHLREMERMMENK